MNYKETIDYLYEQLPMFSRIGEKAYKADLSNTLALCKALDNPQNKFKSIHIAGTNGKGSTSNMLAAILQQAGYKTGLYTSPHIKDFGERIRVNGEKINQQFVIDFTERTMQLTAQIKPSFFELTVAMAFEYFAAQQVDIAVIETGLGGLLDSTNVINPVLSVITNIGYDHINILGSTLAEIARQKAGIIKQNTPVVIGEVLPETLPVFLNEAKNKNAALTIAPDLYTAENIDSNNTLLQVVIKNKLSSKEQKINLDLTGLYQVKNCITVMCAVNELRKIGFIISEKDAEHALENVKKITGLRGRWDVLQHSPTIIVDVAHNSDGIKQVMHQLKTQYPNAALHFIIGFVHDKDIGPALDLFPKNAHYYFTNAHMPRALAYQDLIKMAEAKNLKGKGYDRVNDAIHDALKFAAADDVIIICGSFFIISEIEDSYFDPKN